MSDKSECVKVVVRVRPISSTEISDKRKVIVTADHSRAEISVVNPEGGPPKLFTFDAAYSAESKQEQIYDSTAYPIIESVLKGFNGTIFAYGQTGAGKSHTMEGIVSNPELRGIIPKSFEHVFRTLGSNTDSSKQFMVRCSYLEIYNEEIRDLLARDPEKHLELREDAEHTVYVKELTTITVKTAADMEKQLTLGKKNRITAATLMNATSSRSHAVFTITVETSETGADGKTTYKAGKLNLVDLAGSERQSKTGATGQRLKEANKINQSLMTLGSVISALVDGKATHVPYRDSKLTRLLQDSLGGNTKTVMIANCGPADYNYDETMSTLRYADRAKAIRNKPKVNEDPKDAKLKELADEINELRAALARAQAGGGTTMIINGKEVVVPATNVVERVVEKIVGASEEEMAALKAKAEKERSELIAKAEEDRRTLLSAAAATEEERKKVEAELAAREAKAAADKRHLEERLLELQGKLLVGGEVLDKAAKQEEELRRAQLELEDRRLQEAKMARELEEANIMIEEQYSGMADEVAQKTRKLKKVWNKLQAATQEIQDLRSEFQREREDYQEEVRFLKQQLKLKQLLLDNFVPLEELSRLESRAKWDDESEDWMIYKLELSGNRLRPRRPPSTLSPAYLTMSLTSLPMPQARPMAQSSVLKSHSDSDPRFRPDNIATMDLEWGNFSAQPADKLKVVASTAAVVGGGSK